LFQNSEIWTTESVKDTNAALVCFVRKCIGSAVWLVLTYQKQSWWNTSLYCWKISFLWKSVWILCQSI